MKRVHYFVVVVVLDAENVVSAAEPVVSVARSFVSTAVLVVSSLSASLRAVVSTAEKRPLCDQNLQQVSPPLSSALTRSFSTRKKPPKRTKPSK